MKPRSLTRSERAPAVGILGGMGPEATVELMRRVIAATPAQDDCDHVHMLVDSNPHVPSRIKALVEGTGVSPAPELERMAERLVAAGSETLVIACNTAHAYLPEIRRAAGQVPVLDMIELAVKEVATLKTYRGNVGILASPAVQLTGLYEQALSSNGLNAIFPSRQAEVLEIIKAVKRKKSDEGLRNIIADIARSLVRDGAEVLLIACTELSYIADALPPDLPALDTMDALVDRIVEIGCPNAARRAKA